MGKNKTKIPLNKEQKEVLIGTLLGDASMTAVHGNPIYAVKFEQSLKQEAYIQHLYELFFNLCASAPRRRTIIGGGAAERSSIYFKTRVNRALKFYYDNFYALDQTQKKYKKVPKGIKKLLTPCSLAY